MQLDTKRVSANLRRWQGSGIEPNNRVHIQAYMLARETSERPTKEMVLDIINSNKQESTSSSSLSADFWIIGRAGVTGTPDWLKEWQVTEAELRENYQIPAEVDLSEAYVLDGGCPRQVLGKGARRITFKEQMSTRLQKRRRQNAGGVASEGLPPPAAPAPVLPPSSAAVAPQSSAHSALAAAATAPDGNPLVPGGLPKDLQVSKKARVLKLLKSDEQPPAEEVEATNVEELINRMKKCAKKKTGVASWVFFILQSALLVQAGGAGSSGRGQPAIARHKCPGIRSASAGWS